MVDREHRLDEGVNVLGDAMPHDPQNGLVSDGGVLPRPVFTLAAISDNAARLVPATREEPWRDAEPWSSRRSVRLFGSRARAPHGGTSMEGRARVDSHHIKNRSFRLNLEISPGTPGQVLRRQGG